MTQPTTRLAPRSRRGRDDVDLLLGLPVVLGGACVVGWWAMLHVRVDLAIIDQVWAVAGYPNVAVPHAGYTPPSGPECASGGQPTFGPDLLPLQQQHIGDAMGQPLECEHVNPDTGDRLQRTTTGLAVYQPSSHVSSFTDGWRHWTLAPDGLSTGVGTSSTPPLDTGQPVQHSLQSG